ncbi:MAG: protein translocase subunit SecF, partial [Calditrichota bacterium]
MMKFFGKTNIDFQSKRRVALTCSGLAILIGLISLVLHGGPNYSIDFTGGLSMSLRMMEPSGKPRMSEELVRRALKKVDLGESEVKMSRSAEGEDILIRVKEEARFKPPETLIRNKLEEMLPEEWHLIPNDQIAQDNLPDLLGVSNLAITTEAGASQLQTILDSAGVNAPRVIQHRTVGGEPIWILIGEGRDAASLVKKSLAQEYPDYKMDVRSVDRVGPRMGSEMRLQAIWAILASLFLIVLYLWWRFDFLFGLAAVIATFHDVLIMLGLFSLLNYEISITVIGAFLTLVGYSLNDTIVVFDRIREDMKRYRDMSFAKIVNLSVNDTLSRTIITGLTTLLV